MIHFFEYDMTNWFAVVMASQSHPGAFELFFDEVNSAPFFEKFKVRYIEIPVFLEFRLWIHRIRIAKRANFRKSLGIRRNKQPF